MTHSVLVVDDEPNIVLSLEFLINQAGYEVRVARDGDRDGLPNVLMEAQSQAVPCLSTGLAGIAELIDNGETGLLVEPDDPAALADALARLIADPALRRRLGEAGARRVRHVFDHRAGLRRLAAKFGLAQPRPAKGRTVAR